MEKESLYIYIYIYIYIAMIGVACYQGNGYILIY